jgi:hypothetical protein
MRCPPITFVQLIQQAQSQCRYKNPFNIDDWLPIIHILDTPHLVVTGSAIVNMLHLWYGPVLLVTGQYTRRTATLCVYGHYRRLCRYALQLIRCTT